MAGDSLRSRLGLDEISSGLGKALLAEALGTFFINYFGCMSCVNVVNSDAPPDLVLISLAFGFVVMVGVQALGHVSGANLNPAVTLGLLAAGRVTVVRALLYIVAQCLGAIAGSAVLRAVTPGAVEGALGHTTLGSSGLSEPQGLAVEFLLGFLLVLVVFGVIDPNKPESKIPAPLAIGLAVAVGHLASVDYTGSSMNPARSLGSAVVGNDWTAHWIYWVGPGLGGIAAGLLYTHVLAAPPIVEYSPVTAHNDISLKRVEGKSDEGAA